MANEKYAQTDYEAAYDMVAEIYPRLENSPIADAGLIDLMRYITRNGLKFPDSKAEDAFVQKVRGRKSDEPWQLVLKYFVQLNRMTSSHEARNRENKETGSLDSLAG